MERTLAGMVCSLLVLWIIAWTPYAMLSLWILIFGGQDVSQAAAFAPIIACKLSATLNAFLYGIRQVVGFFYEIFHTIAV